MQRFIYSPRGLFMKAFTCPRARFPVPGKQLPERRSRIPCPGKYVPEGEAPTPPQSFVSLMELPYRRNLRRRQELDQKPDTRKIHFSEKTLPINIKLINRFLDSLEIT